MPGLEIPGEFLRHAVLETVVPHAPELDIEGALTSALEGGADDLTSVLSSIPQRSLLFFGVWWLYKITELVQLLTEIWQTNLLPHVSFCDSPTVPKLS